MGLHRIKCSYGTTALESVTYRSRLRLTTDQSVSILQLIESTNGATDMRVGQIIRPVRQMPDFNTPAVIREKRLGAWGIQYAVVNGFPRNASVRWYYLRDVRPVQNLIEGLSTPVQF